MHVFLRVCVINISNIGLLDFLRSRLSMRYQTFCSIKTDRLSVLHYCCFSLTDFLCRPVGADHVRGGGPALL